MINWKYKDKYYYFDFKKALLILGLLIFAPLIFFWSENIHINYFSMTNIIFYILCAYIIFKNCVSDYEPYYFDEKGNMVYGEEPRELREKRLNKTK